MTGIIMFFAALLLLIVGYPVAFSFGAVAMLFGAIAAFIELMPDPSFAAVGEEFFLMFSMMPFRIYSIMNNTILMAVPLFILMGIVLQKSDLAERLLESMGLLFGKVRGGVAISTVIVGTLLAASTGVVGASVVAMGVISLPVMLKYGYSKKLATGTICAAGTLGQIIPPSIVLIILADQLTSASDQASTIRKAAYKAATGEFTMPSILDVTSTSAGEMFMGALVPGLMLVGLYILYILFVAITKPGSAPPVRYEGKYDGKFIINIFMALTPPLTLILLVLGSIIMGVATVNQAGSVGSVGAIIMGG